MEEGVDGEKQEGVVVGLGGVFVGVLVVGAGRAGRGWRGRLVLEGVLGLEGVGGFGKDLGGSEEGGVGPGKEAGIGSTASGVSGSQVDATGSEAGGVGFGKEGVSCSVGGGAGAEVS